MESSAVDDRPEPDFRALADAMPHLVWTARRDGTIEYLNKRWIEYTGVTVEDLGARPFDVGVVHPDDVDETWTRWKAALATATPYEMEYRLRRAADGIYHWFLSRAVPVRDAGNTVTHWIGTATDIDEQRRARDTLAFMVNVSHALATAPDGPGDFWKSMRRIGEMIAGEIADGCIVVRVENGTLRFEAIVHRDPEVRATLARLQGKRPLRLDAERRFIEVLESRRPMRTTADFHLEPESAWPHLREAIEVLDRE
ncbi:MAG: PAS domain-containing protein, partial [Candidatus Eremiobacteraeota bacterium]|nr:PAS domain-containing protein [Candidatus Eremiobacteraeota bacterium]